MPDVRMNYGSMEQMERAFKEAHKQLDDTMRAMDKVAKTLDDGALLGMAGQAFSGAIRGKLIKRMKVVHDKMQELAGDINGAVSKTRDGVATAKSRFLD